MLFLFFGVVGALVSSSTSNKQVAVLDNSILVINLENEVVDRASENPMENFNFKTFKPNPKAGLNNILLNIKNAKTDNKIKGIYLNMMSIQAGIASIEEIRNALVDFKKSGKFIVSYNDIYTQKAYYLISVADKIYLNPQGSIEWKGLGAEMMFFKGTLEKLGVEPQIIRHGKFKSAIEPYILDKMSDANRQQTITYMGSIWNNMLSSIAASRKLTIADLNMYADSMKIEDAKTALQYKMVDGLKYKDEIIDELKKLSGIKAKEDLKMISIVDYTYSIENTKKDEKDKPKIAVIFASGQIDMGEGDAKTIGSDGLSRTIREARLDSTVKAIVLRVNSPGGSALASEVIWREVVLAKQAKPVIVSMGDVAASGGYYIASPADVIVANPNTITGSIGVFGVLWNSKKLINEKLGVTIDTVKTNAHSDIGSVFRPMTSSEQFIIQKSVENIYDVFISHVSDGRKMTKAQVDSIGQGRVWSGVNAKEIGLIDELGGIEKAIEIAAQKAKLKNYTLVEFPKEKDFFQQFLKEAKGGFEMSIIENNLGDSYKYYQHVQKALKVSGIQARLPFEIDIH